jgi:phosphate transport system substrate-binding protein
VDDHEQHAWVIRAGQADTVLANRPISADEDSACTTAGVDYIELLVGHEVLAFVANPEDAFLQCLTTDQLNSIFAPSAEGQITNWTQVSEDYADTPLTVHTPAETSVTFALLDHGRRRRARARSEPARH